LFLVLETDEQVSVKHHRNTKLNFGMHTELSVTDFAKADGGVTFNSQKVSNMRKQAEKNASRLFLIRSSVKLLCKTHGLKLVTDAFPNKECLLACGCRRSVSTSLTAGEIRALETFKRNEQRARIEKDQMDALVEQMADESLIVPPEPDPLVELEEIAA
jgi:hypothetical protein